MSVLTLLCALAVPDALQAQSKCRDASEDSHYSVIVENNRVRVLALELGRLESTKPHCNKAPYLSIVTTASRTTTLFEGQGDLSHDWTSGEARFHYRRVQQHAIRNDTSIAHREVMVETLLPVPFNSQYGSYDTDEFGSDLTSVKPTWSTSLTRGALSATRTQLASGDSFELIGADHVLIALSDLKLETETGSTISLNKDELAILKAGAASKLTNGDKGAAKFVIVNF
ncbi:MAG TPA: hypothetical protein VN622_06610 [Clostridia bacterium]|nr:hypothetical protein [Clostridia bacterium]